VEILAAMELRKYRWSKVYESAEEELLSQLSAKNIAYTRWTAEPGELFEAHVHPFNKVLWCAEGSIVFIVDNSQISLQPGDTLELPANTMHEATAGLGGCVCYESQV
jgi:quercetin dioxygenase-like cupin family protein